MTSEKSEHLAGNAVASLSAVEIVAALDQGLLTEEAVRSHYRLRVQKRQPVVQAWAYIDYENRAKKARGALGHLLPLHGVPIAIKDLSDTVDMPTAYGSTLYEDHRPVADAACVAIARAAGAFIVGKAATVEFGATRPCQTRNPHNLAHTPGGSSSGSAAAVADGQALLATGSQTGGSIIRPAAFCGVVGFKPSFGALSTSGTRGFSWSLDTLGVFARNVTDATLFYRVLQNGVAGKAHFWSDSGLPPKIARFKGPFDKMAEGFLVRRMEQVETIISSHGLAIECIEAERAFADTLDWQRIISRYEMARSLAYEWHYCRDRISEELRIEIEEGMAVAQCAYDLAKSEGQRLVRKMAPIFAEYDGILTFATPGEAPASLASTGDATFNRSWSLLGFPCISLPAGVGPLELPVGMQLVGAPQEDERLLRTARWLEQLFKQSGLQQEELGRND